MALQAEQVHVAQLQHVRIRSAVDHVAGLASIRLYGLVFEDERPLRIGVALEADDVLGWGRTHLLGFHGAVHVVAIATLDEAFVHAMTKGHVELSFLLQVAGVAELGFGFYEQELRFFRVVRRMAGEATDFVLGMLGVDRVHMLRAAKVAG